MSKLKLEVQMQARTQGGFEGFGRTPLFPKSALFMMSNLNEIA